MKAEYAPRIDLLNRTKLETVIPLATPITLFIDPSDACNFKCKFCPTSDRKLMKEVGRPWKQMQYEVYEKIIEDLKEFPSKIEVLRLYKDGEPLINKKFVEMVQLAKREKVANRIDTTTNASLLTKDKADQLARAGLSRVNISIYGVNSDQYISIAIITGLLASQMKYMKFSYTEANLLPEDHIVNLEYNRFLDIFGDHCDKIHIEHIMSCWPNFELGELVNNEHGIYGQEIQEVDICPYPFYSMSINSDGIVSLCFLDWSKKLLIGDVRDESVADIWNGEKMKVYRKMFLDGKRKGHPICGDCGQMSHGMPDNLDPHRNDILDKLNASNYFNQ